MATPRYPGPNNMFLPVATQQVVSYVRNPKKFKINRYVQNIRSPGPHASYWKLDRHQPARVTSDAEFAWEDGGMSPTGHHNLANFSLEPFRTRRRAIPFTLGSQTVEASRKLGNLDLVKVHSEIVAQQAITLRTDRVVDLLETAANWSGNTASAAVLNGGAGFWDFSSSNETDANYNAIFKSLMAAREIINKATNGAVSDEEMILLLSPNAAHRIAGSGEIRNYNKSAPQSERIIKETMGNPNQDWGLPPRLYGFEVVVENAVIVTDKPYAGDSTEPVHNHVKGDSSAVILSRPGGLDAPYGPSFSTVQCYWWSERGEDGGELEIETRTDDWHRFTEGRCVEQYAEVLAAPHSGYLITGITS